jgi:hypothetical protein
MWSARSEASTNDIDTKSGWHTINQRGTPHTTPQVMPHTV